MICPTTLIEGAEVHPTAVVGFQPMTGAAFARPTTAQPAAAIGRDVQIGPFAVVYAGATIMDGARVCPYAHIREGAVVGAGALIGCGVKIGFDAFVGADTQIMDDTHISGGTIIGRRCFISVGVIVVNDDKPRGYKWKGVTPVKIGNDVVIGAGARVRPGVTIGDGATIAMGAVVVKDVPAGAMVKGPVASVVPVAVDDDRYAMAAGVCR